MLFPCSLPFLVLLFCISQLFLVLFSSILIHPPHTTTSLGLFRDVMSELLMMNDTKALISSLVLPYVVFIFYNRNVPYFLFCQTRFLMRIFVSDCMQHVPRTTKLSHGVRFPRARIRTLGHLIYAFRLSMK